MINRSRELRKAPIEMESREVDGNFSQVPLTALEKIFDYLPLRDIVSVAKVCRVWRSFIVGSSHIWKSVSINSQSPFGGEWRHFNYYLNGFPQYEKNSDQDRVIMDRFILNLANITDLIENIQINIISDGFSPKLIHKLLMKQKRLVSLILNIQWSYKRPDNEEDQEVSECFLDAIVRHQTTLEVLDLSNTGISFGNLAKKLCMSSAEFPKLKAVGYPTSYTYDFDYDLVPDYVDCRHAYDFQEAEETYAPNDIGDIQQCFYQTLKHGSVEEINMDVSDFQEFHWGSILSSTLTSAIKSGLTQKLKKLFLESITCDSTGKDILIENCPQLTQLNCYVDSHNKYSTSQKGTVFEDLVAHYSKNLVSLSCDIDDRLAEVISDHCENLTTLIVADHDNILEGSPVLTLSDKGLSALSKLTRLQKLGVIIDREERKTTANGVIKFLKASVANVKELSLELPCVFYNEENLYEVLSDNCVSLNKLVLTFGSLGSRSSELLNGHVFLKGIQKVIETRHLMKHFDVYGGEWFRVTEAPSEEMVTGVIHSIVSFQSLLKTLSLFTRIPISKENRQFIIEALPNCKICFKPL